MVVLPKQYNHHKIKKGVVYSRTDLEIQTVEYSYIFSGLKAASVKSTDFFKLTDLNVTLSVLTVDNFRC